MNDAGSSLNHAVMQASHPAGRGPAGNWNRVLRQAQDAVEVGRPDSTCLASVVQERELLGGGGKHFGQHLP